MRIEICVSRIFKTLEWFKNCILLIQRGYYTKKKSLLKLICKLNERKTVVTKTKGKNLICTPVTFQKSKSQINLKEQQSYFWRWLFHSYHSQLNISLISLQNLRYRFRKHGTSFPFFLLAFMAGSVQVFGCSWVHSTSYSPLN